jgi:uncharacterized protein with PIN domain
MKSARPSAAQAADKKTKPGKRASKSTRAELMQEAAGVVDALLDWHDSETHAAPTLTEIEEVILQLRKRLSAKMAEVVIQDQGATKLVPGPQCPTCGREMHYKGDKENTVETRVGTVPTKRAYYYCETCRSGLFPPGSPTETLGRPLE